MNKVSIYFRNSFSDPSITSVVFSVSERSLESVGRSRQESLSSVEEDDYDTLADIDSDKNIVRTKVRELLTNTTELCLRLFTDCDSLSFTEVPVRL